MSPAPPPWSRPGVDAVAGLLRRGGNVVFIAPTGYGKSKSTHRLLDAVGGRAARAVHVLPLRALVEELYSFYQGLLGGGAGYLAGLHSLPREGYSGFMFHRLVVSTIDSFSLNLARLSVSELAGVMEGLFEGHYEVPRAALFSSLIVFDEAHLYAEPWAGGGGLGRVFLEESVGFLASAGVPLVIETATLPDGYAERLARLARARVVAVCRGCGGPGYQRIHDEDYEDLNDYEWRTELLGGLADAVEGAAAEAESGRRVLFAANTVGEAVEAYTKLRAMGVEAVLIHGRLCMGDRGEALSRARRVKGGVIVATQVIEAGVDVDAEVLVTAAAAPSALAQRAGRLCRSPGACSDPPAVYIYERGARGPYPETVVGRALSWIRGVLGRGRRVEWRLLDDAERGGVRYESYYGLVNHAEQIGSAGPLGSLAAAYRLLLRHAMGGLLATSRPGQRLLTRFCSLVRGTGLVGLAVPLGDGYDQLEVSLDWLSRHMDVLDCRGGRCAVLVRLYTQGGAAERIEYVDEAELRRILGSCSDFVRGLPRLARRLARGGGRVYDVLPLVKPGVYRPGLGL